MPISSLTLVERIARILAARSISINADGETSSAGSTVNDIWHTYVDDAVSVIRTLREPDQIMAAAGDVDIWEAMVEAALDAERAAKALDEHRPPT